MPTRNVRPTVRPSDTPAGPSARMSPLANATRNISAAAIQPLSRAKLPSRSATGEMTALTAPGPSRVRYEPPTSTMEVFKAPITTKLDSGPRPSAGRATRGRPVAIVPRKAQANAIRLGLAARLPRSCRRVFHMLQAGPGIQGSPRELKSPEEILGREYLEVFQLSRHGGSWVLRLCRETPNLCDAGRPRPNPRRGNGRTCRKTVSL